MALRFVNEGNHIEWTNDSGAALSAGDVVNFQGLVAVVKRDVAIDGHAVGNVAKSPIFEVNKDPDDAEAYKTGDVVYWHAVAEKATTTDPVGDGFELGVAVPGAGGVIGGGAAANGCAATGDSLVRVRLKV